MSQSTKSVLRNSFMAVAAGILALGSAQASKAATITTFAQFSEASGTGNPNLFSYVDTPNTSASLISSTNGTTLAAIPVTFTFLGGAGPSALQGPQPAMLTLTSTTSSAVQTFLAGLGLEQAFPAPATGSDTLAITLDTPFDGLSNLLTATFTGELLGIAGGLSPQLSANNGVAGETVSYTSDFVTLGSAGGNFSLTFSSWTNGLSSDGGMPPLFNSATAAGTGTFDAIVVPEPSTLALGSLVLLLGRRRNPLSKLF
jgi:hypothetical protein